MLEQPRDRLTSFKYDLLRKTGECFAPKRCTLYLTYRCNLKCEMCYQRSLNKPTQELSVEQIDALLASINIDELYLVGGEIFVRRDILEVLKTVERRGIRVTLLTNGTLIGPEALDYLKRATNLDKIIISLDGLPETHDRIRGRGAFNKAADVICALRGHVPIWSNTVILNNNTSELLECAQKFKGLGAERVTFQFEMQYTAEEYERSICVLQSSGLETSLSRDTVRGNLSFQHLEQVREVVAKLGASPAREWVSYIPDAFEEDLTLFERGDIRARGPVCCGDFLNPNLKIGPTGEFEICEAMHAHCGTIANDDAKTLWNSAPARSFRQHLVRSNMIDLCSRCCRIVKV